jgi:hypothetical protein
MELSLRTSVPSVSQTRRGENSVVKVPCPLPPVPWPPSMVAENGYFTSVHYLVETSLYCGVPLACEATFLRRCRGNFLHPREALFDNPPPTFVTVR